MVDTALKLAAKRHAGTSLRQLFNEDHQRAQRYSFELEDLYVDFSKHHIDENSFATLLDWAKKSEVETWRSRLFNGHEINHTESRSVLHMALRASKSANYCINGQSVMKEVLDVREACYAFAHQIREQKLLGITGKPITTIVNIGIGGSDLGPKLLVDALPSYQQKKLKLHFISRLGDAHVAHILAQCDLEETLFIVASKTFTTLETIKNATLIKKHYLNQLGEESIARHFAAVSNNLVETTAFGIHPNYVFRFWDWVGGRYSVWSSVGLIALIALGEMHFEAFLNGAETVDTHFRTAPLEKNIPIIMALLGAWYRSYWEFPAHAILSYDDNLALLTPYLQQLDMESNGKVVQRNGQYGKILTGPIIFGGLGNEGQHAYYQWFHQGSEMVSADFFVALQSSAENRQYHQIILANCFAQSQALMIGRDEAEAKTLLIRRGANEKKIDQLLPYMIFEGNRPSTTFLYPTLTPKMLGMLLALYEHKVFVQGILWNINSFDQWGVELGKELATTILDLFEDKGTIHCPDSSTRRLIEKAKPFS